MTRFPALLVVELREGTRLGDAPAGPHSKSQVAR
jgi:hypothetical protein